MSKRRTQEERRQATIQKLLDATIRCLAERGYAHTSTAQICKRAGLSQGGLFNHFATRIDVVAAATECICRQHIDQFERAATAADAFEGDMVDGVIAFVRTTSRSVRHAAWHEVMVAARTDEALRAQVKAPLQRFEAALLETARRVLNVDEESAERLGTIVLSLMHMFDSEAVTVAIYPNPALEHARLQWAAELLRSELRRSGCLDA